MTKQLGVEQIFIQRGAVKGNKRTVPAARQKVQAVSDKFFTRSALTDNQHRFIQRREARYLFKHFREAVSFAKQIIFIFSHDEINHSLVIFTGENSCWLDKYQSHSVKSIR